MVVFETVSLLAFAFTAGALTFFAPCAYPLLPGYVSFYLGRTTDPTASSGSDGDRLRPPAPFGVVHAAAVGVVASAGFLLVYGLLGGVVAVVGSRFLAGISVLELVVGVLLVAIGIAMVAGVRVPTPTISLPKRRRSATGYFAFGTLYAAAAAGCSAPIFVGVLLEALSVGTALGLATFGAYTAGMSLLMVAVTVAAALGRDALLKRHGEWASRLHLLAGVLLILAGFVEIYLFLVRFNGAALLGF